MSVDSGLILAAGMPRSASTWLYNAVRLLISRLPGMDQQFSCGWIGDWRQIPRRRIMLIKVHDYHKQLVEQASCILYSYRDVRDAIASSLRKFGQPPTLEVADEYLSQYEKWTGVADFVMRYETMLEDRTGMVMQIARQLGIADTDPDGITAAIAELGYRSEGPRNRHYHTTNLFHAGHITDGRHGSWKGVLDEPLVRAIEERHKAWFEKCGYTIQQ